ncbi:6-hydroxy-3-succinoylpyridine 3-monooxygenase HspB [Rosistilla carotiformis]|uniref:6-hydroxy-3-succinoylpyridine 3-monooxygenase HspB n=1 Tax=Rosistilla carotiformis TaxID=2528017 RepID=A0A518JQ03_9BACT|nr:FAD-dependent monooxygenase [Rosistilla carotiformis]QDV67624.1 6-hydroxy-3-succinoylpyridine 3-monooxygenase HspB [Rosistilla carotiformis]
MDPTIDLATATEKIWDVVVVGAGVAGATAAIGIARGGARVLLVDRKTFPRDKVCGACLNQDAVAGLKALGVLEPIMRAGALPLSAYELRSGSQAVTLALPGGLSISRRTMDRVLVEQAIGAGCEFLSGLTLRIDADPTTAADGGGYRQLLVQGKTEAIRARIVIMATGLASENHISQPQMQVATSPDSRVGFGISTREFPQTYREGTIYMAVSACGYVGVSRTEQGQLNIAAAIDRQALRGKSAAEVCGEILRTADFPVCDAMLSGAWKGTTTLTRRRQNVACTRLFVVGDAAGYIEPFTGEGMAWAIRAGRAVAPLATDAVTNWTDAYVDRWKHTTEDLIITQQYWCHAFARTLRYPKLVRGLLRVVTVVPSLGHYVVRQINRERQHDMFDHRPGDGASSRSC